MKQIIFKLHDILNMIKGFEAGYTSKNSKSMIVKFECKNYKVTIEELGEGEVIDYINSELE